MLKFIFIVVLLSFIFIKVTGFIFRLLGGSQPTAKSRGFSQQRYQRRTPGDGNVNVDYIPKKDKKSSDSFRGGEYVDYEEVE